MSSGKKKKLKIAIFHLAFIYSGGGERLVLEEAIGLSKLGYEVTCFSPIVYSKNCFPELMSKVRVKTLFPKLPDWFPDIELLTILASCVIAPLLFFRFRDYDIYFGANQPGPWIAYLLSKINRKPYAIYLAQPTRLIHPRLIDQQVGLKIVDGHSMLNIIRFFFRSLIDWCDTKSIHQADLIFANGSYAKGVLDGVYNINAVDCPAGSHCVGMLSLEDIEKRFQGGVKIGRKIVKKPYVLLTNRHFPHKKFEYAIDALKFLKDRKISLVITGQETSYTRFLKKRLGRQSRVHFVGLLPEQLLAKTYKNAAVYVYPAPEEDFGMGIIEAMAYGIPVVAWGNAGPTGIITDGEDGMLATPFSTKDFAGKIDQLLINRKLYERISFSAYRKIGERFSFGLHNQILAEYMEKIVNSK